MTAQDREQLEVRFRGNDRPEVRASGIWEEMLSRRQILFRGAAFAAGAVLLGACGNESDGGSAQPGASPGQTAAAGSGQKIGVSFSGVNETTYHILTGIMKVLDGTEYEMVVRQSNFDGPTQLADIEDLITQQITALNVLPSTVQATSQAVLKAQAAGIPVVNQFWAGETPGDSAYIGVLETDNIEGGKLVADYIMEKVPDGGEILIVMGTAGQGYSEVFTKGIEDALQDGWSIADIQPGNYVRSDSIDAAQTMLNAHPNAKVLVDYAAEMGVGIAGYLEQAGRKDIIHITSDSNSEMSEWMLKGYITANRYFSVSQTGVLTTEMLREYLENGNKPESFVTKQPHAIITAEDFVSESPPFGVVNPDLDPNDPAFGIYSYEEYYDEAQSLVS